jgi:hypothetical protein
VVSARKATDRRLDSRDCREASRHEARLISLVADRNQ